MHICDSDYALSWVLADHLMRIFAFFLGGGERCNHILMKFCLGVEVPDVITHANLGDDRFGGF